MAIKCILVHRCETLFESTRTRTAFHSLYNLALVKSFIDMFVIRVCEQAEAIIELTKSPIQIELWFDSLCTTSMSHKSSIYVVLAHNVNR